MAGSEIRIGKVSSVNYKSGMVRVTYRDKDESVTVELPTMNFNDEYRMPEPGQDVVVAHLSNGSSRGVLLGTVWNKKNIPAETGKELYRKDFSGEKDAAYARYSDVTGEYLVKAANVHINGVNKAILDGPDVEISANISITVQTEKIKTDLSYLEVTGGEEDKVSASINTDVTIDQAENGLEAVVLKALFQFVEDMKVQAGTGVEVEAEEDVAVKAGTNIKVQAGTGIEAGAEEDVAVKAGTGMKLQAGTGIEVETEEGVAVKAGTSLNISGRTSRLSGESTVDISSGGTLSFSDGQHSITLAEIIERLGE